MTAIYEAAVTIITLILGLGIASAIVYVPYWVMMKLFRTNYRYFRTRKAYRQSCGGTHYRSYRSRSQCNAARPTSVPAAYDILGCSPSDDAATIKKKYRELVKRYHPDHLQSHTMGEEARASAKEKMQQINDAYETVKKLKGITK